MQPSSELNKTWQNWREKNKDLLQHIDHNALEKSIKPILTMLEPKAEALPAFALGLQIAQELLACGGDLETLLTALFFPYHDRASLAEKSQLQKLLPANSHRLLLQLASMQLIDTPGPLRSQFQSSATKNDKLRKLFLTMAQDIRVILLKLCERLVTLKTIADPSLKQNKQIAQQILDIYAPLANRLGIGQLKWQLEDFSMRCLEPKPYHTIAKALQMRRPEREQHLKDLQQNITIALQQDDINNFEISSRAKHITSIKRKLDKKNLSMEQIYDAQAIRVLTDTIPNCYKILSVIHSQWSYIASEFDDYLAHPKSNGYQSIHTVIQTPECLAVEIQIRTFDMHLAAELGVASHWRYKEGPGSATGQEAQKIDLLRELLAWQQKDLAAPSTNASKLQADSKNHRQPTSPADIFKDYIVVFTPQGDLIDLPHNATPLDFAYRIHTDVGHRCKGAKVNGKLVPLTHCLQNGDRLNILTQKNGTPSRDWLRPGLLYLTTSRARQKVAHWFKSQNEALQIQTGQALWDKHIRPLNPSKKLIQQTCLGLNLPPKKEELLIALGNGHIGITTVINRLQQAHSPPLATTLVEQSESLQKKIQSTQATQPDLTSHEDVLMQPARCCQPIPGDIILGYITHGRGISLHRPRCKNIQALELKNRQRIMSYTWPVTKKIKLYPATIILNTENRDGMMRDISSNIGDQSWSMQRVASQLSRDEQTATITITILIDHCHSLDKLIDSLKQLPGIINIYRP